MDKPSGAGGGGSEAVISIPIDAEAVAAFDAKVAFRSTLCTALAIPHLWICMPCTCAFLASGCIDKNAHDLAFAKVGTDFCYPY